MRSGALVVAALSALAVGCYDEHRVPSDAGPFDAGDAWTAPRCDPRRAFCDPPLNSHHSRLGGVTVPEGEDTCVCSPVCATDAFCHGWLADARARCVLPNPVPFCAVPCGSDAECLAGQACMDIGGSLGLFCLWRAP